VELLLTNELSITLLSSACRINFVWIATYIQNECVFHSTSDCRVVHPAYGMPVGSKCHPPWNSISWLCCSLWVYSKTYIALLPDPWCSQQSGTSMEISMGLISETSFACEHHKCCHWLSRYEREFFSLQLLVWHYCKSVRGHSLQNDGGFNLSCQSTVDSL